MKFKNIFLIFTILSSNLLLSNNFRSFCSNFDQVFKNHFSIDNNSSSKVKFDDLVKYLKLDYIEPTKPNSQNNLTMVDSVSNNNNIWLHKLNRYLFFSLNKVKLIPSKSSYYDENTPLKLFSPTDEPKKLNSFFDLKNYYHNNDYYSLKTENLDQFILILSGLTDVQKQIDYNFPEYYKLFNLNELSLDERQKYLENYFFENKTLFYMYMLIENSFLELSPWFDNALDVLFINNDQKLLDKIIEDDKSMLIDKKLIQKNDSTSYSEVLQQYVNEIKLIIKCVFKKYINKCRNCFNDIFEYMKNINVNNKDKTESAIADSACPMFEKLWIPADLQANLIVACMESVNYVFDILKYMSKFKQIIDQYSNTKLTYNHKFYINHMQKFMQLFCNSHMLINSLFKKFSNYIPDPTSPDINIHVSERKYLDNQFNFNKYFNFKGPINNSSQVMTPTYNNYDTFSKELLKNFNSIDNNAPYNFRTSTRESVVLDKFKKYYQYGLQPIIDFYKSYNDPFNFNRFQPDFSSNEIENNQLNSFADNMKKFLISYVNTFYSYYDYKDDSISPNMEVASQFLNNTVKTDETNLIPYLNSLRPENLEFKLRSVYNNLMKYIENEIKSDKDNFFQKYQDPLEKFIKAGTDIFNKEFKLNSKLENQLNENIKHIFNIKDNENELKKVDKLKNRILILSFLLLSKIYYGELIDLKIKTTLNSPIKKYMNYIEMSDSNYNLRNNFVCQLDLILDIILHTFFSYDFIKYDEEYNQYIENDKEQAFKNSNNENSLRDKYMFNMSDIFLEFWMMFHTNFSQKFLDKYMFNKTSNQPLDKNDLSFDQALQQILYDVSVSYLNHIAKNFYGPYGCSMFNKAFGDILIS